MFKKNFFITRQAIQLEKILLFKRRVKSFQFAGKSVVKEKDVLLFFTLQGYSLYPKEIKGNPQKR